MATPLRDLRKNQPKPARKPRLITPPTSWMGGTNSGPSTNGSSGSGRGSGLGPGEMGEGPQPRRDGARPNGGMNPANAGPAMSVGRTARARTKPEADKLH